MRTRSVPSSTSSIGKENCLEVESVIDVNGDLEIQEDGGLSPTAAVAPLGELTISTHGQGEVVTGSVRVVSDGPIGGVVRFDIPGIGVAGVGASEPTGDALFPARRQAGGIRTAAAIHNLGMEPVDVQCRLMKNGVVLEEERDRTRRQRSGRPVHRGGVHGDRHHGLRGVGALYGPGG